MVSQSGSVGYTVIGKTADLTDAQKTAIDSLHKEGSQQKVIAKEAACSECWIQAYSLKVEWRENVWQDKGAPAKEITKSLRGLSSKIHSRI